MTRYYVIYCIAEPNSWQQHTLAWGYDDQTETAYWIHRLTGRRDSYSYYQNTEQLLRAYNEDLSAPQYALLELIDIGL